MQTSFATLPATTRGIITMLLAIFCLCSMDAIIKGIADKYGVFQLVWVRFVGQAVLACLLLRWQTGGVIRTSSPFLQVLRSALVFIGTVTFFIGFTNIDLAAATTILQVNPVLIAIGAWLVLGERFGWRRMLGICAGLIGVVIIIRPGSSVFSPYALFPLIAASAFAVYAIATRFLSDREDVATSFFFTTLIGTLLASIVVPFYWTTPELVDIPIMVLAACFGAAGQYLMIRSLFLADASVVSPFGYSALVFAAIYGMVFFNEFPDMWTLVGALIVVGSGLYIWHRESAKSRETARSQNAGPR